MGAWGNGPFANDDALDLVGDLEDSERPLAEALEKILNPVRGRRPNLLDRLLRRQIDEGENDEVNDFTVVAAAAVVAAALGLDVEDAQVKDLLAKKPLRVTTNLRVSAREALARATSPESEWFELWQESGELDQTQAEMDRIRQFL